jgi:acid phosphatase
MRGARGRAAAAFLLAVACAHRVPAPSGSTTHEKLNAVLWVRTSGEWAASAYQAYALAGTRLDQALEPQNKGWTAAVEQTGDFAGLPPAVVVDIDEAILDNSEFEATLIEGKGKFDLRFWKAWVRQEDAIPIPGAVEFTEHARARGVRIFYVSNRAHDVEGSTRENLRKLGFPVEDGVDTILSQAEREDWGSDKSTRRAYIAETHRIVLIVGDDLNDFVTGARSDPKSRLELTRRYGKWWGTRWILLPNPVYGTWERSLYQFDESLPRGEILRRKYEALDGLD